MRENKYKNWRNTDEFPETPEQAAHFIASVRNHVRQSHGLDYHSPTSALRTINDAHAEINNSPLEEWMKIQVFE